MGHVKDSYLHHEKSGDQYVDIVITCLLDLSTDFTVDLEYFDNECRKDNSGKQEEIYKFMNYVLSGSDGSQASILYLNTH